MRDIIKKLLNEEKQSRDYIASSNIKDRALYPYVPTIVIDEFYEFPDLVREWALDQDFFKGDRGSWPGVRTELLHIANPELFDLLIRRLLEILKAYDYTEIYDMQTGFQLIDKTWGTGWVHDDDPKLHLAGVIYLNPDAPLESGTTLYADQIDFNGERYSDMFMEDVFSETEEKRNAFQKFREEQRECFTPTTIIGNVYNRCIIFDTRNWHSADNFFGTDKFDTRLTQVFFCKLR